MSTKREQPQPASMNPGSPAPLPNNPFQKGTIWDVLFGKIQAQRMAQQPSASKPPQVTGTAVSALPNIPQEQPVTGPWGGRSESPWFRPEGKARPASPWFNNF